VPGSVEKYNYYWREWVPNVQSEVIGSEPVRDGYNGIIGYRSVAYQEWDPYANLITYSYTVGHDAWAAHRCWFARHHSTLGTHQHNHSNEEGDCPLGHNGGYGWYAHEARQWFWDGVVYSGSYYEGAYVTKYRDEPVIGWIDTSYSRPVYGDVDRGLWVDKQGVVAPAPSGTIQAPYMFDVRWKIYVSRQGVADPRPVPSIVVVPGSLTFNYTEVLLGCTDPT
jgi:hypothetical protein